MACTEIDYAFDWAKKSQLSNTFPVAAFFTRHQGILTKAAKPSDKNMDVVTYATGYVTYVPPDKIDVLGAGHLAGDLIQFENSSSQSGLPAADTKLRVQIFADGTVIFQDILNQKPVPSPITVKATCVDGVLLTGSYPSGVIVVGVRREPEDQGPH